MMRIVLMGNGPFAVPSFERIASSEHEVVGVVARPPVQGQGKGPPESPVTAWARDHGLPVHTPSSINEPETVAWLAGLQADLLVVCDYGQILKPDALASTPLGGINLHGSLLPRHRGAAPVQWSILAGDVFAGVSVIHMTPALDAGPVLTRATTRILPDEDAGTLEKRLSQLGIDPTMQAIAMLQETNHPNGEVQDRSLATRAPRLKKADGELHWDYAVQWIDRQIRGLQPWPGVFTHLEFPDGKSLRVIVHRATPVPCQMEFRSRSVGEILSAQEGSSYGLSGLDRGLAVVASDGVMVLDSVQPAGKKSMSGAEFMRGYAKLTGLKFRVPTLPHPLLATMIDLPAEPPRYD
jgi:methionyl-tRNA formyltransferase